MIAFDAVSNSNEGVDFTSLTFSHTVGTLTDGILIVGTAFRDAVPAEYAVTGVTYDGVALTSIRADAEVTGTDKSTTLWYLVNPTAGAHNVVVSTAGTVTNGRAVAMSFSGVDQTNPLEANNGNNGTNNTTGSVSVTTVEANAWIVDVIYMQAGTGNAPGGSQAQKALLLQNANDYLGASTQGPVVSPGPTTMSWTWSTESATFSISAVSLKPSGIVFDAASNSGYLSAAAEPDGIYSWNHTCTGANRYLVVGLSMLSVLGSNVTGITYNGVSLVKIGHVASVSGAVRAELWGLVAPATGTNAIQVTLSAALDSVGCAVSLTGVHQVSPIEGFNSASATNVGAADATVNVTTVATNDWIIDQVATDDTAITVGAGQTSRNNVTGTLGSGADSTEGPKTPAGSVTMSWTNVGALATWSIAGIGIRDINAVSLTLGAGYHGTLGWF